ncbi:MerR family transcriptional regulator [Phenylobacterium sp.]|uniref:MerR family transcriptional regulator n=1 Tax=Phenylobacterium sp. TaxID=1871053 RepID=UPI0025F6DEF4|nr:MerR family transcriptional regulator [Phenylobacterium sp.]
MAPENLHHLPRLGMANAMRIFGMTARALRFYEERGLVEARRDRLNARYYDPVARGRLAWISRLRKAGVSLTDIEDVLRAEDEDGRGADCARDKLAGRREALAAELAQLDSVLADLRTPASDGQARRLGLGVRG